MTYASSNIIPSKTSSVSCREILPISHLTQQDLPAIQDHLLTLSDADRNQRFHTNLSDYAILQYTNGLDFSRMVFTGSIEKETGRIAALAEAHFDKSHMPTSAEISISVLPEYRGTGMSADLLGYLLYTLRICGIEKVEFFYQPHNRSMAKLLRAFRERHILSSGYTVVQMTHNDVINFIGQKNDVFGFNLAA
ncbi:MAG: GNAT family N-acetyltransferase [Rhodospirillales bacterium]|jgi:N-acetylglutamate synthase-like GNAT family acetyltransferase|nr:GNAT family N-acetyltransferase [Rhodospirillales bacterium]